MSGIKGPCINLDPDYFEHHKIIRLVGRLGRGSETLPIRMWCHLARHHAKDGRFTGYSAAEIETVINWWGRPGRAVAALLDVRLLDQDPDGTYQAHDWALHEGHIWAMHEKGQRMAEARWSKLRGPKAADVAPLGPVRASSIATRTAISNADSNPPSFQAFQATPLNPPNGKKCKSCGKPVEVGHVKEHYPCMGLK